MAYSADGATWTRVADNKLGYTEAVAYGAGKFVAGCAGGISYSADGVTWTRVSGAIFSAGGSGGVPASGTDIYYAGGKFLAKGGYQGPNRSWRDKISYSADGVTWTRVADPKIGSLPIQSIAYGGGKFVTGNG